VAFVNREREREREREFIDQVTYYILIAIQWWAASRDMRPSMLATLKNSIFIY